jgi:DNA repair exonuclease SbcCD ATPase subunit
MASTKLVACHVAAHVNCCLQELQQQQRHAHQQQKESSQQLQLLQQAKEQLQQELEQTQQRLAAAAARASSLGDLPATQQDQAGLLSQFSSGLQLSNATHRVNSKASQLSLTDSNGLGFPAWVDGEGSCHHQQQLLQGASSGAVSPTTSQAQLHHHLSGALSGSLSLAASIETVQQLQRRVAQLQQEVTVAQRERDAAGEQLYLAVKAADAGAEAAQKAEKLKQEYAKLEHKVRPRPTMLLSYGCSWLVAGSED